MRIEKIIKMKNNKYKINIDGQSIITYDNVILDNDILYKKNIDDNLYKKILIDTKFYDIYNKALKYSLKKRRSEKEIFEYLQKEDLSTYDLNNIINKLKKINLINDTDYCRAFINDKINFSNDGINKIKTDLLKQNISIDIINKEIINIDKELLYDKLNKIINKKINLNKNKANLVLKKKILNDMINLGYDYDDINNILLEKFVDDKAILKSKFNILYSKLEKKYNGNELKQKLKQKLFQQGFSYEDINELITKKMEE